MRWMRWKTLYSDVVASNNIPASAGRIIFGTSSTGEQLPKTLLCCKMSTKFKNRRGEVAVVTGGSNGIGRAAAEAWIGAGGTVVVADLDEIRGRGFEKEIGNNTVMKFVLCDVSQREDLETVARAAVNLGRLTCWFSNAGVAYDVDNINDGLEHFATLEKMLEINCKAHVLGVSSLIHSPCLIFALTRSAYPTTLHACTYYRPCWL